MVTMTEQKVQNILKVAEQIYSRKFGQEVKLELKGNLENKAV